MRSGTTADLHACVRDLQRKSSMSRMDALALVHAPCVGYEDRPSSTDDFYNTAVAELLCYLLG